MALFKNKLTTNISTLFTCITALCLTAPQVSAHEFSSSTLEDVLKMEYAGERPKESTQYDFFIGEWDVTVYQYDDKGEIVDSADGVWFVKYLHDKRVIFDDVVFSDGKGKLQPGYPSLRTYSPKLGKWMSYHMAPLATQASCTNLGTWKNNEMHIESTCKRLDGTVQGYSKVRFYNIKDNSWDYTWESSKDKQNWSMTYTFKAQRKTI